MSNKIIRHITINLFFLAFCFCLTNCSNTTRKSRKVVGMAESNAADLRKILKRNKLVVLAENSVSSYFIYRGHRLGFEYEILKEFAKEIGVKLEVKTVKNLDDMIPLLQSGQGDIIACNFTITKSRKKLINFSDPILRTEQVLVQRKPKDWREMSRKQLESALIRDPMQLSRKTVYVWPKSSYYKRLSHLQRELGDTIILKSLNGDIIPEEAMEMVSKGFIDYTVVDGNVALINQRYFPNLDTKTKLSVKQRIAFGLRKQSPLLRKRLNTWLEEFMKTPTFSYIKHKYFYSSSYSRHSKSKFSSIHGNRISRYDAIVKRAAKKYGWDWRLVSAVIYQESKFNPNQQSWVGAYGLMQFMPSTGPSYGVFPHSPPDIQINGGVKKLNEDYDYWKSIPDSTQRIKFALATYNAGLGHVLDAQRLAKKYGKNPLIWDNNVEEYIKLLAEPKYYNDKVVRYGYVRGSETYNYVQNIFVYFEGYKTAFPKKENA